MVMWLSSWSCHWVEETWWNWTRLKCWNPKNINDYSGIALVDMSWHAWLFDGVSPESFELQWPASTAMISLLKLNRSCPGKQEMENHEESNKFRHEPRESTPERSSPAFGLGFQALKTSRIRDTSSKPSTPGSQKRQVVMAAFKAALSCRASISARSTQRHLLVKFEPILLNKPRPGFVVKDRLEFDHLAETDLLISCKFAPDGFQDVPAHRRQSNFQVFKQELVRHFPQAAILHNLRNGRHKLGAQVLPLSPLCELLHTVLLQFGDWTARCEPRLHCPWCFHILQCFIHLTWVAHCCRRFLYCNFNVLYSTIHMCVCIYIMYYTVCYAYYMYIYIYTHALHICIF